LYLNTAVVLTDGRGGDTVSASLPDVPFHEHQHSVFDANLRFVETDMRCVDGHFELPRGVGLGVEPKAELWKHIVKP
jgi:L-alanine-DL-glutamate epimerase-like enolase superfamily enzyme